MTSPLDEAVGRVSRFAHYLEEGWVATAGPRSEVLDPADLRTILNALSPDEPDPRASILAIIRANRQAGESEQVLTRDLTTLFRALQASRVSPDEERVARLFDALEPFANLADANMNDPLCKWLTVGQIKEAECVVQSIVGERDD
jgi:hypothetical protein